MNDCPIVSIIMPAYNEEKHIAEAINSILNQTFENFEFIIINDGSIDRTEAIILSYSDPRIIYVKNEINLKLINSLNKGLSLARGKYIARMDSDDISLPERLQKQVLYMETHPDIGICGAQLIVFGTENTKMEFPLEQEDLQLRLLWTSCYSHTLVMFRKEIMDKHNLRYPINYLHAEDYKFWTQWLEITKGANIDEHLAKYRFHLQSISHLYRSIQKQTIQQIRIEYLIQLFKLDKLNKENVAIDFYGQDYDKRIASINFILTINLQFKIFSQDKLKKTIYKIWYLDSLSEIPNNSLMFLKFTKIFTISLFQNLKYWEYIFKGTVKKFLKIN